MQLCHTSSYFITTEVRVSTAFVCSVPIRSLLPCKIRENQLLKTDRLTNPETCLWRLTCIIMNQNRLQDSSIFSALCCLLPISLRFGPPLKLFKKHPHCHFLTITHARQWDKVVCFQTYGYICERIF